MPSTSFDTPRVYLTVNPDIIAGKRLMTVRSMVTALDKHADLYLLPISEIDFKTGKMAAYRRCAGGKFVRHGRVKPQADLWIVYTDGYYLNTKEMGYKRRIDYLHRQLAFYENVEKSGTVGKIVNEPDAERNTLKDWLAELNPRSFKVIPTFDTTNKSEIHDLLKKEGRLVAKPIWGGDGMGVRLLNNDKDLSDFFADVRESGEGLRSFVYQKYAEGPEKRLLFTGDQFAGARICYKRKSPWAPEYNPEYTGAVYQKGKQFERDLEAAKKLWKESRLSIGSVDFIGDQINEINGCGTTFCYYVDWTKVADARPQLVKHVLSLIG